MTVPAYLLGVVSIASVMGVLALGSYRWRARLLPNCTGAQARLVEAVLMLSAVTVISELLGSMGAFRPVPVLVAMVGVGLGAGALAGPPEANSRSASAGSRSRPWSTTFALVAIAPVVGRWIGEIGGWFNTGILDIDSLTYHLPHAANFVQDGWLTRTYQFTPGSDTPYHPSNTEVFHALGMLFLHRDTLSLAANVGWLILFLGACWCIGQRYGAGPLALVSGGVLLATPLMAFTQAGSAQNDLAAVALLLAAVAILVHDDRGRASLAVAGLSAGLALGTKLTAVVPVAVIAAGLVWTSRRRGLSRGAAALTWGAALLTTGGYWYVRNLVAVGSPIPALDLRIGGIHLPHPRMEYIDRFDFSVAHYAFNASVWRTWFLPALRDAIGLAWPAVLVLAGAGLLLALRPGRRSLDRILGVTGLIAAVAYVFTPTTAYGARGTPLLFLINLRYLWPTIVLGLLLLAVDPLVARIRWVALLAGGALVVFLATRSEQALPSHWTRTAVVAVVVLACAAVAFHWRPRSYRASAALAAAAVLGTVVVGYPLQQRYLDHRYADRSTPFSAVQAWAQDVHDRRIGVVGSYIYPYYGKDLSNQVRYVLHNGPDHAFTNIATCAEWRRAVDRGGYDYVVTISFFSPRPPAATWTRGDPGAIEVFREGSAWAFRIEGPLQPDTCPGKGSER